MDANGFKIGDKVVRGNGKKVMTVTNIRAGQGMTAHITYAALNGGTLYDVRELRHAPDSAPAQAGDHILIIDRDGAEQTTENLSRLEAVRLWMAAQRDPRVFSARVVRDDGRGVRWWERQ